jgi:CRP-like cAMP-binding protein
MMTSYHNRLLMALPPEVLARLTAQLESVKLRRGIVLVQSGGQIPYIYFPDCGLVSLVKTMSDGRSAEISFAGPEGLIGLPALLGIAQPDVEAVVQLDGSAHRLAAATFRAEILQDPRLHQLILKYLQYQFSLVSQTAACNRLHTLRQRCCRWLLTAQDCVQAPSFTLTHECLALMLGTNRPRLSITLKALQQAGAIRYRYAFMTIMDRAILEDGSCECYETLLRRQLDEVYRFPTSSPAYLSRLELKKSA